MSSSTLQILQPAEYFRERVSLAAHTLQCDINDDLEFYLVNLLCDFIEPERLTGNHHDIHPLETPLAVILKTALESPPDQKLRLFKQMGDTSLYVAGCFQDYFNRKTYDIDYYIGMGKNAYLQMSQLMQERHKDEHFAALYDLLAKKFPEFVEIFALVSEETMSTRRNADILTLYDRWNSTGSERLKKQLEATGIEPITVTKKAQ